MTRPDIAFDVNLLSRYKEHPGIQHWKAAKQIVQYLKGTIEQGIIYNGSKEDEVTLLGYSDADWAGDQDDRKSTIYEWLRHDNVWRTSHMDFEEAGSNALSTLESEYIAAAAAIQELIWLRRLIISLNNNQDILILFCDNQGTIKFTESTQFHRRTKHIDNKWNFVKDEIQSGRIQMKYVSTEYQLADILTKGLAKNRFNLLKELLSLRV